MSVAAQSAPVRQASGIVTDPIRVMVVDDSVVARGLMARWLDEDPELAVVETHRTGRLAVENVVRAAPDVIVLDIEMPDMDGLTALPLLLRARPGMQIIMASTLTRRNAEISMKAIALGAADYVPKPESNSGVSTSPEFRRELVQKVKALGARARIKARRAAVVDAPSSAGQKALASPAPARPGLAKAQIVSADMRRWSSSVPRIVAIGSSTGGPQALSRLLAILAPAAGRLPIVITQHMPATFTAILAENLGRSSGLPCAEGQDGQSLESGRIYIAPGGRHMVLRAGPAGPQIALQDGPAVNFCKPAVDPLFESVAALYGPAVLAAVLTGMGNDGGKGALAIANAGGNVIAQDEETSVVWGMPQAVVQEKACAAVLPLDEIGATMARILKGMRP